MTSVGARRLISSSSGLTVIFISIASFWLSAGYLTRLSGTKNALPTRHAGILLAQKLTLAGAARLLIQDGVSYQDLPTIPLHRPQVYGEQALRLQGRNPAQGDANDDALVETAFAELRGGNIGLGDESADLDSGGEAPCNLEGDAAIARQILSGAQQEVQSIPG